MRVYQTGPDRSLDDVLAAIESDGLKFVQAVPRQGGKWTVFAETVVNDTGRPWAPTTTLGQTETRTA